MRETTIDRTPYVHVLTLFVLLLALSVGLRADAVATEDCGTDFPSASWTVQAGTMNDDGAGACESTAVSNVEGTMFWNAAAFDDDQYAQLEYVSGYAGPAVRVSGTGGSRQGYVFYAADGKTWGIYRFSGDTFTLLGASTEAPLTGDTMKLVVAGTTLTAYQNDFQVATATDPAYASGSAGAYTYDGAKWDNWDGGNGTGPGGGSCPGDVLISSGVVADLQDAIDAAAVECSGVEATISLSGTYSGAIAIPNTKTGTQYITIRTDDCTIGSTYPTSPAGMATLQVTSGAASAATVIWIEPEASYWRFECLHITKTTSGSSGGMIFCGDANDGYWATVQDTETEIPHHIQFVGNYITPGATQERRGVMMHCNDWLMERNYIAAFSEDGADSQCIAGFNGGSNGVFRGNYCVGAGENVIWGGADSVIPNFVASGMVFEGNVFTKPLSWVNAPHVIKNLFELKCADDVIVRGNRFSNNWGGQGQNGNAVLLTPENQDGSAPWCKVTNVLMENNVFTNVEACWQITGHDASGHDNSGVGANITIRNNFCETKTIDEGYGRGFDVFHGPENVIIDNNTIVNQCTFFATSLNDGGPMEFWPLPTTITITDNLVRGDCYGLWGFEDGAGAVVLEAFWPDYVWSNNVVAGRELSEQGPACPADYPAGTTCPTQVDFEAQFVNYGGDPYAGDYRLVAMSPYEGLGVDWDELFAALAGEQGPGATPLPIPKRVPPGSGDGASEAISPAR